MSNRLPAKNLVAAMILSAVLPAAAFAQSGSKPAAKKPARQSLHDEFTGQGYGMAGCGLGSVVFGPKPGMIQIVAATLNGTAGNQTFGITFGTSNCDIPEMGHQAAMFIETNRETLAKEAARGKGETVVGLAYILKCQDAAQFGQSLQKNYESIFTGKTSYDATRAILNTIDADTQLQASCQNG